MAFNSKKVEQMVRSKGIMAKDYYAYVYPDRSGNASFPDIIKNVNPKAEAIERIANLLDCSIDELFDREEKKGGSITASNSSTVFNGNSCDQRLLDIIQSRDRQIDKLQTQIERLLDLLEERKN